MKMLTKRLSAVALVLAALVSMTTLTTAGAVEGTWTGDALTIRVELDLPENSDSVGPLVQQVTNVIPGDQVELTSADIIENPSNWCGSLWVDIDPDGQTVQVSTGQVPDSASAQPTSPVTGLQDGFSWDGCDFSTATVTITGAGFGSLTVLSDRLWNDTGSDDDDETPRRLLAADPTNTIMNLVGVGVSDAGDGRIAWAATPSDAVGYLAESGAARFAYTLPEAEEPTTDVPTTTVTDPVVEAPVTTPPSVAQPAAAVTRTPTYTG